MEQTRGKWAEPLINNHVAAFTPSGYTDEAGEISSDSSRGHLLGKTRFYLTCWPWRSQRSEYMLRDQGTAPSGDLPKAVQHPMIASPWGPQDPWGYSYEPQHDRNGAE